MAQRKRSEQTWADVFDSLPNLTRQIAPKISDNFSDKLCLGHSHVPFQESRDIISRKITHTLNLNCLGFCVQPTLECLALALALGQTELAHGHELFFI